jgi:hypothetical protein
MRRKRTRFLIPINLVGFNRAVKREKTLQLVNSGFCEAFLNGVTFSPQSASAGSTVAVEVHQSSLSK